MAETLMHALRAPDPTQSIAQFWTLTMFPTFGLEDSKLGEFDEVATISAPYPKRKWFSLLLPLLLASGR